MGRILIKEDTFYKQYLKEKNILVKHTAGYKQMSQVLDPMDQEPVSRTNNRYIKTYLFIECILFDKYSPHVSCFPYLPVVLQCRTLSIAMIVSVIDNN
jgi:hypothetical protein